MGPPAERICVGSNPTPSSTSEVMKKVLNFWIKRSLSIGTYKLTEISKGLEISSALKKVFRKNLAKFLDSIELTISKKPWIIWVDDKTGRVMINRDYLKDCSKKILYLDLIHELIHVKQFREGKKIFDKKYKYVERPTEIEAYKFTVEEAKRIGMDKKEIEDYLKVEWVDENDHKKLVGVVMG